MKRRKNRVTAKLRLHPDPILTQVCEPVADGEDMSGIIRDMMHILVNSKTGVGLAAPQAGHLKRIILVRTSGGIIPMVNPEIKEHSGDSINKRESCLSYPGKSKYIHRHVIVLVACSNYGKAYYSNMEARIIQHEIDHLNGKCLVGA